MLVAKKQDDRIVVGVSICDHFCECAEDDLYLDENVPIWKVKGEKDCYVFADKSSLSVNLLRYNDNIFKGITDGRSVIEKVVPKIKSILDAHSRLIGANEWGDYLLIVKGNKMFTINEHFNVCECDDVATLGYLPFLIAGLEECKEASPEQSILSTVKGLERLRNKKLFPLVTFDTKTKRRKIHYN